MSGESYKNLSGKIYIRGEAYSQYGFTQKICHSRGRIVSAGVGGVNLYDIKHEEKQGAKLESVQENVSHEKLKVFNSVTTLQNGHFIVAAWCEQGLLEFDGEGYFYTKVLAGNFADVTIYDGHLYALDHNKRKILFIKLEQDKKWVTSKEFQLDSYYGDVNDRVCVNGGGIFVSSTYDHCVLVYDNSGKLRFKTGELGVRSPGKVNKPYLCGVDNDGLALVADSGNQR